VGHLVLSNNGGWAQLPNVYFIIIGGKKGRKKIKIADTINFLPS
jgi:hypothetical protein